MPALPRVIRSTLAPVLLALAVGSPAPNAAAQDAGVAPQARPVLAWLSAVHSGEQEQLKAAFSARMQRQFEQEGWGNVLTTYQASFRKAFGEYALADFRFEFVGGEESGHVNVVHNGNKWPAVRVIRESTGWKVDER